MPIDDDRLFRAERATVREEMARALAPALPSHSVMSSTDVDARLAPITKSGARCAYEHASKKRRAAREGFWTTETIHVLSSKPGGEKLWIKVANDDGRELMFEGPWNPKLERVERYRTAFATMVMISDGGGGLGLVDGIMKPQKGVIVGPLSLCERQVFTNCAPESEAFRDQSAAFTKCLAGSDEVTHELVFDGQGACELTGVDAPTAAESANEACLCTALKSSAGLKAKPARRLLAVSYEAPDLAKKPRPELRVVDSSGNLDAREDWRSFETEKAGKPVYASVQRLSVDNLDAPRAALARCSAKPGSALIAELTISPTGTTTAVRLPPGSPTDGVATCVTKVLERSTFTCTLDENPGKLRVAITWPE